MRPGYDEQETIIRIDRLTNRAEIYTSDTRYMNKFDKLVEKNPEEWKFKKQDTCEGDVCGKYYSCPDNLISFREKTKRVEFSEEQKQKFAETLRRHRETQKSKNS